MLISGGGPDFGPESYLDTVFPVNLSNRRGKLGTQAFASAVVKQLKGKLDSEGGRLFARMQAT